MRTLFTTLFAAISAMAFGSQRVPIVTTFEHQVCYGDTIYLYGMEVTGDCVVFSPTKSSDVYDSIEKHVVTFHPSYHHIYTVWKCPGEEVEFFGNTYSTPGEYTKSFTCVLPPYCDSTYTMILMHFDSFHETTDTTSLVYPFAWRGRSLTEEGTYYDSLRTTQGCDSIYELRLRFDREYHNVMRDTMCSGDFYVFGGERITTGGTYFDSLKTVTGRDSVIELLLFVPRFVYFCDTINTCQDYYVFRDTTLRNSGEYDFVWKDQYGCDSAALHLSLHLNRNSQYITTGYLDCSHNYTWRGGSYNTPGRYVEHHTDIFGCDSDFVLILNRMGHTEHVGICQGDSFAFRQTPLTEPGIYYDTLLSSCGEDSITTLILNVYPRYEFFDTARICEGSQFNFRGRMVSAAGNHYDSLRTTHGCDSIYQLHLIVAQGFLSVERQNLCSSSPVWWRGRYITQSGTYTDSLKSHLGCDSVYVLDITLHNTSHTIDTTICDGMPYRFGGRILTQSGIYHDTLRTLDGCDSVVNLNLRIIDRMDHHDTVTICESDIYPWHGMSLTNSGTYYDTIVNAQCGCNEYHDIVLNTIKETKVKDANGNMNRVNICGDDDSYMLSPTFTGTEPTTYSITYDGVTASHSNDIYRAEYHGGDITIPTPRDDNGNIRPDIYYASLSMGNEYCDGSSHTVDYVLTVEYPSDILDQHFNDVVSVRNERHNGGYTFAGFRWVVNGAIVEGAVGSNLYMTTLKPGDIVYAELLRPSETAYIPTCPIVIRNLGPELQEHPMMLTVSYYMPGEKALIQSNEKGEYRMYDMRGMLISTGIIESDVENEVEMPYISGCYMLNVSTATDSQTLKVIVK